MSYLVHTKRRRHPTRRQLVRGWVVVVALVAISWLAVAVGLIAGP